MWLSWIERVAALSLFVSVWLPAARLIATWRRPEPREDEP